MYVRMYLHINSLNLKTHTAGHARDRSSYVPVLPGTPTRTVRLASHSQRLIINNRSPCQQRFCYELHSDSLVRVSESSQWVHLRSQTFFNSFQVKGNSGQGQAPKSRPSATQVRCLLRSTMRRKNMRPWVTRMYRSECLA
jgi:hypothetical protein